MKILKRFFIKKWVDRGTSTRLTIQKPTLDSWPKADFETYTNIFLIRIKPVNSGKTS
jgi:hypothetical protein